MLSKQSVEKKTSGTLYVVATPIGNLSDITLRALEVLKSVDLIAAEDTRHTRKLLSSHHIHTPMVSYHSHSELQKSEFILQKIAEGRNVALVTDAGTPGISDPGTLLIQHALAAGIPIVPVPGPAALICALVVSGLPSHPFAFLGFPPSRGAGRRKFFQTAATIPMTLVLYESPHRLTKTLTDILHCWGNRTLAIAREMTKIHEEVFRGTVEEALKHFASGTRGELTLVIAGHYGEGMSHPESTGWEEELAQLLTKPGMAARDAIAAVSSKYRLPRKTVYRKVLELKESHSH